MAFTPEQIAEILQIVDARLQFHRRKPREPEIKDYHSIQEIRDIIVANLRELESWFGDQPFDIAVLRDFIARKTKLRPGDNLIAPGSRQSRFEHQVSNAIGSGWPTCPIVSTGKRRQYRIKVLPPVVLRAMS